MMLRKVSPKFTKKYFFEVHSNVWVFVCIIWLISTNYSQFSTIAKIYKILSSVSICSTVLLQIISCYSSSRMCAPYLMYCPNGVLIDMRMEFYCTTLCNFEYFSVFRIQKQMKSIKRMSIKKRKNHSSSICGPYRKTVGNNQMIMIAFGL